MNAHIGREVEHDQRHGIALLGRILSYHDQETRAERELTSECWLELIGPGAVAPG